jgi:undecaprenyl diphosphate synthase
MSETAEAVVPRHLGLILDGNRRWAKEHGLPIYEGQLMRLFMWIFKHELGNLKRHGVRVHVLGNKLRIGKALLKAVHHAQEETKDNTRGTLLFCLDYGGQQEIVDTMKAMVAEGMDPNDITAEKISEQLRKGDVPPVDLIIRTSGEQRLSNFMLWNAAYSELMFTPTKWPDFTAEELGRMLDAYAQRKRRFGK